MGNRIIGRLLKTVMTGLVAGIGMITPAMAAWELNMPKGVTDISQEIYSLHMIIFWVCVGIGIVVFGAMIYSIIYHRKSVHPEPATFSHSTIAEIGWTVIPIIILIVMAYPAAKTLVKIEDTGGSDLTVQVTGYQWNWHYEYPAEGISFYSKLSEDANIARRKDSTVDPASVRHYLRNVDKPMVVPVDKKVRILLTANDVIHAWWVPELGGKKDAVPGFVNQMWFKANELGTYRGQCAELCGRDHGFMPIVVEVVTQSEFEEWAAAQGGSVASRVSQASAPVQVAEKATAKAAAAMGAVSTSAPVTATQSVNGKIESGQAAAATAIIKDAPSSVANKPVASGENDLMAKGKAVYLQHCVACHQANGAGMPPAFPALTDSAVVKGPATAHIDNVVNGRPGTAMMGFGSFLNDKEIAAVVTYERNALGNSVGDAVSAADVAAVRGK